MRYLTFFFKTIQVQMKNSWARPMFRFTLVVNPILTTIIICEMFKSSGRIDFGVYIILGSSLMSLWTNICFSSIGDINRERMMGTLPYLYVSLVNFNVIIVAKMIANIILSLLSVIITIMFSYLLYGVTVSIDNPLWILISIFITIISFSIISMFVAYTMLLTRKTQLYMNLVDIPVVILSGFVFPITILPTQLQLLSNILLPTWAVKLMREVLTEGMSSVIYDYILMIIPMILIYLTLTLILWKFVNYKIKRSASLEVF